jgi:hypothetical protein
MGKHRTAALLATAIFISVPTIAAAQLLDVLGVEVDVDVDVDLGDGLDLDASANVGGGDDPVLGVGARVELGGNEGGNGGAIDNVLDSILGPAGAGGGLDAQLDTLIALGGPAGGGINSEIDALMALGGEPGSSIGGLDLDSIFNLVFADQGGALGGVSGNALLGAGGGPVNPNTGIDLDLNLLTLGGVDNGGGNGPGSPGTPGGPGAPPSVPPMVFGGGGGSGGGAAGGGPAIPSSLLTLWASLNPTQQQRLVGQCLTILGHPRDYRRDWVDLCRHVGVLPGVQQVFVAVR